jgi:hypothetical protein
MLLEELKIRVAQVGPIFQSRLLVQDLEYQEVFYDLLCDQLEPRIQLALHCADRAFLGAKDGDGEFVEAALALRFPCLMSEFLIHRHQVVDAIYRLSGITRVTISWCGKTPGVIRFPGDDMVDLSA